MNAKKLSRKNTLLLSCVGFVLICISLIVLIFLSKYNINKREYNLSEAYGLKIVFFSDIHIGVGKGEQWVEKVVKTVNDQNPDIIIIGGDFIENKNSPIAELFPLKKLESKYGIYAVLGNHDHYNIEAVKTICSELEIKLLINEIIQLENTEISITGIDDLWYGEKYNEDLIPRNTKYNILISHNPAIIYDTNYIENFDLILSGHTHAGQGNIPILNYSIFWPFDDLERKYRTGKFELTEDSTLIISSGVGENAIPLRIFAQPTIEIIYL